MKDSQAEIKAIQAKLQAIQAGRSYLRQPTASSVADKVVDKAADRPVAAAPKTATTLITPPVQSDRPTDDDSYPSGYDSEYNREELATAVETLQQRSSDYLQQFRQLRPQPTPQPSKSVTQQQVSEAFKRLEAKAQYINELSTAQEVAMLELKSIAEKLERDWKAIELEDQPTADLDAEIPTICEYLEAIVPHIEKDEDGTFVLTARPVDLFKAEREAAMTAQTLRHRVPQSDYTPDSRRNRLLSVTDDRPLHAPGHPSPRSGNLSSDLWQPLWEQCLIFFGIKNAAPPRRRKRRRTPAKATSATFDLQDAVLWLIGAATARIGLNLVLANFPGFWLPVAALIVIPAAIAIYRTSSTPQSNLVWGYRLLVVMIGLLIGGRLS
jgi:hypothetical protein